MERMEPLLAYVWGRCVVPGEKLQVGSFWRSGRNINTSNIGTNLLSLLAAVGVVQVLPGSTDLAVWRWVAQYNM